VPRTNLAALNTLARFKSSLNSDEAHIILNPILQMRTLPLSIKKFVQGQQLIRGRAGIERQACL
jgi:hypothetical protein